MIELAETHTIGSAFGGNRVVPVVVLDDPARAVLLGNAIVRGGVTVAEVTLRTPQALSVLRAMTGCEGLTVGAGSVTHTVDVDAVVDVGGQFIVSPGFSPQVALRASELAMPYLPGCVTATDIMAAQRSGIRVVKFFPAEAAGGVEMIRALAAPFPSVRFVPTGGITSASAASYLSEPSVFAVGGSWMVPNRAIAEGAWDEITRLCQRAVEYARSATMGRRDG